MALARLALKYQQNRLISASPLLPPYGLKRFTTTTPELKNDSPDSSSKKSKSLFPISLWRKNRDIFSSGLGDALHQATENLNRVLKKIAPSRLLGRYREDDECYKIKYHVPGLAKEDLKITVEDGVLHIRGEHKEEEEDDDDQEEHWSSYGYYNASVFLPDDAKTDEIKAQLKDGVLRVVIPRTERPKRDVKEVEIL